MIKDNGLVLLFSIAKPSLYLSVLLVWVVVLES